MNKENRPKGINDRAWNEHLKDMLAIERIGGTNTLEVNNQQDYLKALGEIDKGKSVTVIVNNPAMENWFDHVINHPRVKIRVPRNVK